MDIKQHHNEVVGRLIDFVDNESTDMAPDVMKIPSSSYSDPQRWHQEVETIFKRLPILVGVSHEIPEAGCFKTIDLLGMPLLITRLKDGSAQVMLNVCSHRGMLLTKEQSGKKAVFSCPYHGWTFSADGALRGIADTHKFGEVEKSELGLTRLPTFEKGGLIFAILSSDSEVEFESFLSGMIDDIADLGFPDWHYCGQREIYGGNWKVAYDGYLEGYHFAAAHPETILPRTFNNTMDFQAYGPHILLGYPQRSIAKLKEVPQEDWWKHENDGYDFIRCLFPNVAIFVAPEITQIAQLIPGPTPDKNRTVLYYLSQNPPKDDKGQEELERFMDWLKDVVQEEDYDVGLAVQQGLESGAHQNVVFGRNEKGNQYFHRWLDYYMKGDLSAPKPIL